MSHAHFPLANDAHRTEYDMKSLLKYYLQQDVNLSLFELEVDAIPCKHSVPLFMLVDL